MTDHLRAAFEALLDGSINDHLDGDHDNGEVHLASGRHAESCDTERQLPDLSPANLPR